MASGCPFCGFFSRLFNDDEYSFFMDIFVFPGFLDKKNMGFLYRKHMGFFYLKHMAGFPFFMSHLGFPFFSRKFSFHSVTGSPLSPVSGFLSLRELCVGWTEKRETEK